MARSGPKPQPTALKIIRGNPGKRPLPTNEAQPELGVPEPPGDLSEQARQYWATYAEPLADMRVLTVADQAALALLCEATATFWESMAQVRKTGLIIKMGDKGYAQRNPFLTEANSAQKQVLALLTEFGLTPSSRTRVQTAEPGSTNNRFA